MLTNRKPIALAIVLLLTLLLACVAVPASLLRGGDQDRTSPADEDAGVSADTGGEIPGALAADTPLSPCLGSWTAAVRTNDDPTAPFANYPDIAVDASGNSYAVWADFNEHNGDIYSSFRPSGGSWTTNIKVNDDSGTARQQWPRIAADSAGNAYAVWLDQRNGAADIYFATRSAGGVWSANSLLIAHTTGAQPGLADIAADAAGNLYLVWEDTAGWDIYFSYRPAGGSWSSSVRVSDDATGAVQAAPAIAVDGTSNAYAVWYDERNGGGGKVYGSYRPAGGNWGPNTPVTDIPYPYVFGRVSVAADQAGNAYAVWIDARHGTQNVYFSTHPAGGSWSANTIVTDASSATDYSPAIAVDAAGNAYAIWQDARNGKSEIYASYRPLSGNWGTNVAIDHTSSPYNQSSPALAIDASARAYAVWVDGRYAASGGMDIFSSDRPSPAVVWAASMRITDASLFASQTSPAIATDWSGTSYAVWVDRRQGNSDIFASLRWPGLDWQANVKVNDDSGTADQSAPAITMDGDRNAYVVWQDRRNGNNDIYFSYRPFGAAGTGWQPNVKISNDPGAGEQTAPVIALDADRALYAAWEDTRNGNSDIYMNEGHFSTWLGEFKVTIGGGTSNKTQPALTIGRTGTMYLAWRDDRNGNGDVYFSETSMGMWGPSVKINDDAGQANQSAPAIAVDPEGGVHVVWQDQRNGNSDIYYAFRPAGGNWAPNVKISDDSGASDQSAPTIGIDSAGNVFAAWQDQRTGEAAIYFSYRPRGGSWHANSRIDVGGSQAQEAPAIAVENTGIAHAVWQDLRNGNEDIYSAVLPMFLQRLNAGGSQFAGSNNRTWCADRPFTGQDWGFVGGLTHTVTATIANTYDQALYQTDRLWDSSATPGYRLSVPNGYYWVTLKFAETICNAGNCRLFDVRIEGQTLLSRYDIFAAAGASNTPAPDRKFLVHVVDGELTIDFMQIVGKPKVNAIEVRQAYVQQLNAGGPSYADMNGQLWLADRALGTGYFGYLGFRSSQSTVSHLIAGTTDPALYQSGRTGMLEYAFWPPYYGSYKVTLKFSENEATAPGQRIFDVRIGDTLVLSNFDIYAAAGNARFKSVDRTFSITVTDGPLTIDFWPKIGNPSVNAIAIVGK